MKKKVLFIGRFPPPVHGAAKVNENYFDSKIIRKYFNLEKIRIGCPDNLEKLGKFNKKRFFEVFSTARNLKKRLSSFNPDLIYFEIAPTGLAFLRDSLYALICKFFNKKIIFQIHARGIPKKVKNTFWKRYYKFVFKNTKMILLSNLLYPEVKDIIPKKNIFVLPNGIENNVQENNINKIINNRNKKKKKTLLFISNMVESKGALDVLKICNELNNKKNNFECLFVGPWQEQGFEEKWKRMLKEYKLEKKCKYLGPKYRKDKAKILAKTDFLIFPTKYPNESFPLVILEAFMIGIPVFSYDQGAIKEIISKNFLGFVSNKKNWKELAKELERRISKKQKNKEIREHFNMFYDLKIAEDNLRKIFTKEAK